MKFFSRIYNKMIFWAAHRHAPYYLAAVSFAESSFFPIPPDVMLLSMGLAKPVHAWRYAFITTLFSVLGGLFGYLIGFYGMMFIYPLITEHSLLPAYNQVLSWFDNYGIWIMFVAGFAPIPYKIFTIAAGSMHMALLPFIVGSWVGRGLRFYLVSACMFYFGSSLHNKIQRYIDKVALIALFLLIVVLSLFNWVL